MSDQVITQEQLDQAIEAERAKWEQEHLQPLQAQLAKLKPAEPSDQEKEIAKLKADLLQQKVVSAFKEANMDDFLDIISINDESDAVEKVSKLSEVLKKRQLTSSYQPQDHKQTDAYSKAEQNNDVKGMITAKLSKLFQ